MHENDTHEGLSGATYRAPGRPRKPIGRNVMETSLKPRAGHKGQFIFTLDGDRGTVKLYLTEEEVRSHFTEGEDRFATTFHMEPGAVATLLKQAGIVERRAAPR